MKTEIKNEIASVKRDILNLAFMGILRNNDSTLATRGNGKGLKIYDDIERDCHAFAVLQKRKMAVIARPWVVEPASDSFADQEVADFIRQQLERINFDKLTLDLLDANLKGFAVSEILWQKVGNNITVDKIYPRDQTRFNFDVDYQLHLLTQQDMLKGELMPERKFIVHSFGGKDGNPYGLGLGSRLFWPVFFKRQDISFWLTFADKFGSPTLLGKYPAGTGETEQTDFINKLTTMAQDAAIAVPDNMMLELLEASRGGGADVFERVARYMDEQISVATLGETMTTSAQGGGLGGNQSGTHNDVRLELVKADADLLSGTLNQTLIKWLTEFNYPNAVPPRVYRIVEEDDDLNLRAERDERIAALGFKPTLDYITENYGEGWELAAEALKGAPTAEPATTFAENAEFANQVADQLALDQAIDLLASDQMQGQIEKLLKPITKLVNENTPEALQGILAESYSELDSTGMQELMARAFFVAEVWGRLNGRD